MKYFIIVSLLVLSSCAIFQKSVLSENLSRDIKKVCLSSEGKGRIVINNQKYLFSYESALREEDKNWIMALNFPIYGEEYVQIDWQNNILQHEASFESKMLKDQKGLSPEKLELFLKSWGQFLHEIILLKSNQEKSKNFNWDLGTKELKATSELQNNEVQIIFKNLVDDKYFGRYDITTQSQNAKSLFKIEVIVRKCLESDKKS